MKNINYTTFISAILFLILVNSCSIEKRVHRPGYSIKLNKKLSVSDNRIDEKIKVERFQKIEENKFIASNGISDKIADETVNYSAVNAESPRFNSIASSKNSSALLAKGFQKNESDFTEKCDNIVLKNGDEISAKVLEIGSTIIRYKRCDNLEGPFYTIEKSTVFMIKFVNGTKQVFDEPQNMKTDSASSIDAMAIVSFALAVLGLGIGWWVSGLIGIAILFTAFLLGIISLGRTKGTGFRGKELAIVGIVMGIIGSVIYLLILATGPGA